jgi:hypothetical protein
MEEKLVNAVSELPFVAAMILLIYMFGRYLSGQAVVYSKERTEFLAMFKDHHDENVAAREASRQVIDRNSEESKKVAVALEALTGAIRDMRNR